MKPTLSEWLDYEPAELQGQLSALAERDLATAFDSAVIVAKNVRLRGVRMPLIVDFIAAQFSGMEKVHCSNGADFSALGVVGDYESAADSLGKRAAEIFRDKIYGIAQLDEARAKAIALSLKSVSMPDNPVRSEAVIFLVENSDLDELADLARHAHRMSKTEQMTFLDRVEEFVDEFPGTTKAIMDGFINRVGVSLCPIGQKADDIFERSKSMVGPVMALITAGGEDVTYVSEDDEPDIIVPFDRAIN